jgi:hypothetical protein
MEGEEWARQAIKLFEFGEDRDILNEGPRPCRRLGVVLGCTSSFFGTKLSVYEGNFVVVLVGESELPVKLVQVFGVELSLKNRCDFLLGYTAGNRRETSIASGSIISPSSSSSAVGDDLRLEGSRVERASDGRGPPRRRWPSAGAPPPGR